MQSPWRLLGVAAALNITLGTGTALAQRVMVRHLPPGTPVEIVLNAATVGQGTVDDTGDVTIPFTLPEKDGKPELDAYVFVDICQKSRRVVIVDAARAPSALPEGCDRREISGLFWVRRVNTIVVDLEPANPTLLLINGNYTPPKPMTPEEAAAGGEERPHDPLPRGLVMFAAGGLTKLRDFGAIQCGNTACDDPGSVISYAFGATYWLTRNFGVEGSYLNPSKIKITGGTDTQSFNTSLSSDIWAILGKAGVQAGAVRLFGHAGYNYHEATTTTEQTINGSTQKVEIQTKGWNPIYGGGAEVWFKKSLAIFGEVDFAKIKGNDEAGGEAVTDDRATSILVGIRLHIGG
jgi:hypothetical protein